MGLGGQSRRWMILVATVWIQAFTGTNFDFSSYSSEMKEAMGISQLQLNYLAVASDLGKAFGWSSGLAILYIPLPAVLFLAAALGFIAYGAQWLLITSRISLPYAPVFMMCLLAGLSICWFNTVCFVLCIRNFSTYRSLAISLTVSFNGVSAALYTLAANAVNGRPYSYLLLNAVVPILASLAALLPILRQPPDPYSYPPTQAAARRRRDAHIFLILNAIAFLTGLYLLLHPTSPNTSTTRLLLAGALLLLAIPGVVVAREWVRRIVYSEDPDGYDDSTHKQLIAGDGDLQGDEDDIITGSAGSDNSAGWLCRCSELLAKDRLAMLGEEHGAKSLIRRVDFWLYYISYLCGGTVGLVYSNNIGQIAQSLGRQPQTALLVNLYSSCSFFGRLLSAAPDFLGGFALASCTSFHSCFSQGNLHKHLDGRKARFARTGWMAAALVPMPLAFFILSESDEELALFAGTALVGLSSGFVFAAAVSVTSELFGPGSFGVNHNIVITNIPLGSLLYGLLAALVYDANGTAGTRRLREADGALLPDGMVVCMGRRCYAKTFIAWGGISMFGLACGLALYLRTRAAYTRAASYSGRRPVQVHCEDF